MCTSDCHAAVTMVTTVSLSNNTFESLVLAVAPVVGVAEDDISTSSLGTNPLTLQ